MEQAFRAVEIAEDVYWVGAIDWDLRNFHGYLTSRGSTYNAYLILGKAPVLIDTVKAAFYDEMMARIASVIDPPAIEFIVSNHSEMDHTGCLLRTIDAVDPKGVYASKMGRRALAGHFGMDAESITVVGDGDTLEAGDRTLSFVETRMCHWPDSMVSYLSDAELLFSQDAFGMHLAGSERFADEIDRGLLDYESAKYYANILLHLSPFVRKTLDRLKELNLPLSMIAPDHGPIWRRTEDIERILGDYARWSEQKATRKVVVVYDSMWGSTAALARAIGEGLAEGGATAKLMGLSASHRSDVVTELLEAGGLIVGSPTMNNQIFPAVADVMTYLKGLRPRNLVGASFGSFGWSGEAPQQLAAMLRDMGITLTAEPLRVHYVPDAEDLARARELGLTLARAMQDASQGGTVAALNAPEVSPPKPSPPAKCKIDINDGAKTLHVEPGKSLFDVLGDNSISLPTICGGRGMCGLCKVTVLSGGGKPNAVEKGHLTESQLQTGLRLGCQVKVTGDLAVRVPEEVLDARPFRGRVEAMTDLTHDIKLLRIELLEPERIAFVPGQYVKLNVPAKIDPSAVSRAFSIASPPNDEGHIELIVRLHPGGACTNWIFHRLSVGGEVAFAGPYGDFRLSDSDAEMIWVAGGSGMSSFWSILRHVAQIGLRRKCTFFFGAVARRDLYLLDELQQYEKKLDWLTFLPALSAPAEGDDWTGETGLITDVLARHVRDGAGREAYLCGSPGMIEAADAVLRNIGIGEERTFYDKHEHL